MNALREKSPLGGYFCWRARGLSQEKGRLLCKWGVGSPLSVSHSRACFSGGRRTEKGRRAGKRDRQLQAITGGEAGTQRPGGKDRQTTGRHLSGEGSWGKAEKRPGSPVVQATCAAPPHTPPPPQPHHHSFLPSQSPRSSVRPRCPSARPASSLLRPVNGHPLSSAEISPSLGWIKI